jgi:hypothetical protein
MSNPPNEPPRFVTCRCQHCNDGIEFDASHAGETAACPYCGQETKLFVPKVQISNLPKNVGVEIKRGVSPLGIASLVLGISACVFCWIPFLGLLAIPISVIGFLLAVIGITAAIVGKRSGLSFPIGGAVACVVATLIALFVTGGISRLIVKSVNQSNSTNQKIPTESPAASTPASLPAATTPQSESSSVEDSWSKSPTVMQGDIKVTMSEMRAGQATLGGMRITRQRFLYVNIVVQNLSTTKKIDFKTWRSSELGFEDSPATLADNFGNKYKQQSPPRVFEGHDDEKSLYPNDKFSDVLYFEAPVQNIQWLHLELPAKNFGGEGMIRFEVAIKNIEILEYANPVNPYPAGF